MELTLWVRFVSRRLARTTRRRFADADTDVGIAEPDLVVRVPDPDEFELQPPADIQRACRDLYGEQGALQRDRVELGALPERTSGPRHRLHARIRRHAPEPPELPRARQRRDRRQARH